MSKSKMTYEAAMQELQTIVTALQDEMVSIDDLSKKVNRAAELIEWCRTRLKTTEQDLDQLFE